MKKLADLICNYLPIEERAFAFWCDFANAKYGDELQEIESSAINSDKIGGNMLKFLAKDWVSSYNWELKRKRKNENAEIHYLDGK
jgi:hypothetical protein